MKRKERGKRERTEGKEEKQEEEAEVKKEEARRNYQLPDQLRVFILDRST